MLRRVLTPLPLPSWWMDAVVTLPRFCVGYWLATRFGWSKFPPPEWFVSDVGKLGFPVPVVFAWAAVMAEVVGGAALAAGLATRIAGATIAVTMLVAALVQKADASLWEKLPSLGFLWVALYAIVLGSGRFGLDYLLFTRKTPAST
jgi:putative oxidoreductase